jgi:5-methylcytosine-specific restriction endonuclease McrA
MRDDLVQKQQGRCHYCNCLLINLVYDNRDADATLDHIIPQCEGGKSTLDNLVVACFKCNRDKGNLSYNEYEFIRILRVCYWQSRLKDLSFDWFDPTVRVKRNRKKRRRSGV